jgi:methyl-accepting chemotaxis protein
MSRNWTFGQRIGAAFTVSGLVLLLVGLVGYRSIQSLRSTDDWVKHTYEVRETILALSAQLEDAESGQRGYIITGLTSYLEPYQAALSQLDRTFGELRRLTADNADQQRRLDVLRGTIDSRIHALKEVVALRAAGGVEAAAKNIMQGQGKALMDQFRRQLAEMSEEEGRLLSQRRVLAEASVAGTRTIILWGGIGGTILVALIGWYISRTLARQVGGAVRHMQSSSAELQSASSQQATGAKEQATAITEITTTISELLATSRQIAESASRVSQIAELATGGAREGSSTVALGLEAITTIRRQVDLIVNHMLELGRKSQQIGGVLEIVSELAEQTNILAINATIEAAGAGEAGKRFAVVADEIRKLADRVALSAKEIRGLIEDIRAAVNTTVMTTETGSKSVEAGSRQFNEVASVFKQIAAQLANTADAAKEIGLSTKQQATAVEQVNLAITSVAQAARETEASTGQTQQTASQLAGLSSELLRLVQPQARAQSAN